MNDVSRTQQLLRGATSNNAAASRSVTLSSLAGSLDSYQSAPLSDALLAMWMKEGFPDYAAPGAGIKGAI
ncbi:hypothetical protein EON64_14210, partial [archaeon]